MYTMVLMMAMSSSADSTAFGGRLKGGSCQGVVVTQSVGCVGYGAPIASAGCAGYTHSAGAGCVGTSRGGLFSGLFGGRGGCSGRTGGFLGHKRSHGCQGVVTHSAGCYGIPAPAPTPCCAPAPTPCCTPAPAPCCTPTPCCGTVVESAPVTMPATDEPAQPMDAKKEN